MVDIRALEIEVDRTEAYLKMYSTYKKEVLGLNDVSTSISRKIEMLNKLRDELAEVNRILANYDYLETCSSIKLSTLTFGDVISISAQIYQVKNELEEGNGSDVQTGEELMYVATGNKQIIYKSSRESYIKIANSMLKKLLNLGLKFIKSKHLDNLKFEEFYLFYEVFKYSREMTVKISNSYLEYRARVLKDSKIKILQENLNQHYKIYIATEAEFYKASFKKDDVENDREFYFLISYLFSSIFRTISKEEALNIIDKERKDTEETRIFKHCLGVNFKIEKFIKLFNKDGLSKDNSIKSSLVNENIDKTLLISEDIVEGVKNIEL